MYVAGLLYRPYRGWTGAEVELLLREAFHTEIPAQDFARPPSGVWHESGYLFTTATGEPIHPRTDHKHWKQLLDRAGVPDRRLHDARHTAATVLLLLGVPERTVMGVMGWSNTAMAARYQHITDAIRRDVAERVGGLLWRPRPRPRPDAGTPGEGQPPAA